MSEPTPAELRARSIELAVFLALIVPPTVLQWFIAGGPAANLEVRLIASVLAEAGLVALVVYLNWRSGEPLARIGWSFKGAGREAAIGALLFVPFAAVGAILATALQAAGVSGAEVAPPLAPLDSAVDIALVGLLLLTVAIAEETIFRGYLLLRIGEWSGSKLVAVLGSAVLFSLGHAYEGVAGMITVGVMGVMLAGLYLWRGSLIAAAVIHLMQDVMAVTVAAVSGS